MTDATAPATPEVERPMEANGAPDARTGARPMAEREAVPPVWFAGRWRSPEAVERKRQFYRERQRQRRREGTGR